jgi:hypothetical protein
MDTLSALMGARVPPALPPQTGTRAASTGRVHTSPATTARVLPAHPVRARCPRQDDLVKLYRAGSERTRHTPAPDGSAHTSGIRATARDDGEFSRAVPELPTSTNGSVLNGSWPT